MANQDASQYTLRFNEITGALEFGSGNNWFSTNIAAGGGVTSLNTLTGAVTLAAGSNITLTPSGNTITVASTGGGGAPTVVTSSVTAVAQGPDGDYFNVTSISLTAGTWDIMGQINILAGGGLTGQSGVAISENSGNTQTDQVAGLNQQNVNPTPASRSSLNVFYRYAAATTTTIFLKCQLNDGTATVYGTITAILEA